MKALRVDGSPRVVEIDPPAPGPGEARIRVLRAGVCSTDLEIVRGYMRFSGTLGHELVGEVIESPDPSWVGRRVAGEINLGCGRCERCLAGLSRHCATRTVLGILGKDGCFAEEVTLPVVNLHAIPESISDDVAVFVEPLAAAFEVLEQVHVPPSARVLVLGDGKLGALVAMVLVRTGAEVTVLGRYPRKLERLRALGARAVLDGEPTGGGFDVVVEATGSPEGLPRAQALLRPRGTLVLKSTFHGHTELATAPIVIDEISIVGSRCGPFGPAVRALAGAIDPSPLVDAVFPLAEGVRALERAAEPGAAKILIAPGAD